MDLFNNRNRFKKGGAKYWIFLLLFTSLQLLVTLSFVNKYYEKQTLYLREEANSNFNLIINEASRCLQSYDYDGIEKFIRDWGEVNSGGINSIVLTSQNGFVIGSYMNYDPTDSSDFSLVAEIPYSYYSSAKLTAEFNYHRAKINKKRILIFLNLIIFSSFLALIIIIWISLRKRQVSLELAEKTEEIQKSMEHLKIEIKKRKRSQQELSTLMSNLPGMAYQCEFDNQWTMLFVNEASILLTGYTPEQLIKNREISFSDLIHPDDREFVRQQVEKATQRGEHFELEYRIHTADGAEKWVWERGIHSSSMEHDRQQLEGVIHDITSRKQMEVVIQKNQDYLEEQVRERTRDLEDRNSQLERFNKLFVDREFRIKELRDRVAELENRYLN